MFHHIPENTEHTTLESGMCIREAKRHSPVGISSKEASEGGLLLVFHSDFDMKNMWSCHLENNKMGARKLSPEVDQ